MNMFNIRLCAQRLLLGTDGFLWLLHIFLLLIINITVFEYSFFDANKYMKMQFLLFYY